MNIPFHLAIVGLGAWGEQLLRVALHLGGTINGFDRSYARMKEVKRRYPSIRLYASYHSMLSDPSISAVIIATPPHTHYSLAKRALEKKMHVLVEKPMTQNSHEARQLIEYATKNHVVLMVDHTFLYSSALMKAKQIIDQGIIGRILRIESMRLGGLVRPQSTVLWDLAPHDIAIAHYMIGSPCTHVQTLAAPYTKRTPPDHAVFSLTWKNNTRYIGSVSWTSPTKVRQVTCIGTKGACVVSWSGKKERITRITKGIQTEVPCVASEPLERMMRQFFKAIRSNVSKAMYQEGYDVVRTVEALHQSWKRRGYPITV